MLHSLESVVAVDDVLDPCLLATTVLNSLSLFIGVTFSMLDDFEPLIDPDDLGDPVVRMLLINP